jgi:hypothetical protein
MPITTSSSIKVKPTGVFLVCMIVLTPINQADRILKHTGTANTEQRPRSPVGWDQVASTNIPIKPFKPFIKVFFAEPIVCDRRPTLDRIYGVVNVRPPKYRWAGAGGSNMVSRSIPSPTVSCLSVTICNSNCWPHPSPFTIVDPCARHLVPAATV